GLLGDIAVTEANWNSAATLHRQALRRAGSAGAQASMARAILRYAARLTSRGQHRPAIQFLGALSRIGDRFDRGLSREVGALVIDEKRVIAAARVALG